jgi:hypothetical protein
VCRRHPDWHGTNVDRGLVGGRSSAVHAFGKVTLIIGWQDHVLPALACIRPRKTGIHDPRLVVVYRDRDIRTRWQLEDHRAVAQVEQTKEDVGSRFGLRKT